MSASAVPRLLEPKGARVVFYKSPDLKTSEDRVPVRLTYSARVLHHVIPAVPGAANGAAVGFSLAATPDGSVRAYSGPAGDFLGLIERVLVVGSRDSSLSGRPVSGPSRNRTN